MTAIAKPYNETTLERGSEDDNEHLDALARLRRHKTIVTKQAEQKIKALDLPEISGNLSRKKFFFF